MEEFEYKKLRFNLLNKYMEILEVLGWIDPDIAKYINQFDNVDAKIHLALSL